MSAAGAEVLVDRVRKRFDRGRIRALEDVTLRVAAGEFLALTGPSGCGKSTLLNLLGALDRPDAGRIVVGGRELGALGNPSAYRAGTVGFVFQFHYLIATLSALENVELPLIGRARGARAREARARSLLSEVGLADRAASSPTTLSGGERQRVAIARALVNRPRLLLADEPTGALDAETGGQVLRLLEEIRDRYGMTVVLVTNDAVVAAEADRVLRLRDGKLAPAPAAPPAAV